MDFANFLIIFSVTQIVAAIAAIAAIKFLPSFARWAYNDLMRMFRGTD